MFDLIYNQIYYIGIQAIRYGKRFFRWLGSLLLKPIKFVGTLIFTLVIVIDKLVLKLFHESVDDFKELVSETKRVMSDFKTRTPDTRKRDVFKGYVLKAFSRYKKSFIYVLNVALPVISLIILFNVVSGLSDMTFALEVNYNDEVIGYVSSEAVYKEARQQAIDRLDISAATGTDKTDKDVIDDAEYKIKPVKRSQINDATTICDKLIEKSDSNITNACGIYIDNAFVCAVKNETDALSVFDSILAEHETGEANAVVSFVQNIEYVQGLYPDEENIVRDAAYLNEKLRSKKSEARYYTVQSGDTVSKIAKQFNMKTSEVFNLNPELRERIYVGQQILLSGEVGFVQVQTTKTEVRTVEIPYNTIKVNTDSLYVGDKKVVTKGVNGVQQVTELVTYIDGVRVSTKEVSRVTVKEAVDEKVQIGTKKNSYGSSGGPVISYGGRFVWPASGGATHVSSYYGKRSLNGWHGGIDITRPGGKSTGAPVLAAESGTVKLARVYSSYGYCVIIDHGGGLQTLYAHMKPGSLLVSAGQKVKRGQQIGQIGSSGFVTGPHLHFEVRVNGNKVNPAPYLGIKTKPNS